MVRWCVIITILTPPRTHILTSLGKFKQIQRSLYRPVLFIKSSFVESRKMSVFTQQLNPLTGRLEWGVQPEDYDYKQEVARSAYADMLHDKERNDKYYEGLRRAVAQIKSRGDEVRVLDIGTGTGLLSMMAVMCGADVVTACEAFHPMAECARKCLTENGLIDRVKLVPKRSTELVVGAGAGADLEQKANLLVAELFDTELIGEGAIETYRHARDFLLTEDALLVPSEGTIYAQVVSSKMLQRWNKISPIVQTKDGKEEVLLSVPSVVLKCPGAAAVHDLQLSRVPRQWITPLSDPLPVLRFDWSGRNAADLPCERTTSTTFQALNYGSCDAVLMWWDVKMYEDVVLSCAPYWSHPDLADVGWKGSSDDIPWRDHWMQAVYYLPQTPHVNKDSTTTLLTTHDEYSLWFNMKTHHSDSVCTERPVCECGIHIVNSRTRLGQFNDPRRTEMYTRVLEELIKPNSVCLMLGDGCLMAIVAARLGARQVYMMEGSEANRRVAQEFITANGVQDKVTLLPQDVSDTTLDQLVAPVSIVFSEPYFSTSMLPWHSLYCWYMRNSCVHLLAPTCVRIPLSVCIWGIPVAYRDLWKIRAPLKECCGFKMNVFDKLIETACAEADELVEPQPLWEYPALPRSQPISLMSLDLSTPIPEASVQRKGVVEVTGKGEVNGMALWVEWKMTEREGDVITTGPIKPISFNEYIEWDVYSRQGVYLFRQPYTISSIHPPTLQYSCTFQPLDGTINFDFHIEESQVTREMKK